MKTEKTNSREDTERAGVGAINQTPHSVDVDAVLSFDGNAAMLSTRAMWLSVARQISDELAEIISDGELTKAMLWASAAEAAFWQASGDADTFNVKDIYRDASLAQPNVDRTDSSEPS